MRKEDYDKLKKKHKKLKKALKNEYKLNEVLKENRQQLVSLSCKSIELEEEIELLKLEENKILEKIPKGGSFFFISFCIVLFPVPKGYSKEIKSRIGDFKKEASLIQEDVRAIVTPPPTQDYKSYLRECGACFELWPSKFVWFFFYFIKSVNEADKRQVFI